ncbi:hypothetical protein ACFL0Z_01720 [Patescibacteria group bacterium]
MPTKHIILMILSLAGLGMFGFPLVRYWSGGYDWLLLLATILGLPLIGILAWQWQKSYERAIAKVKAGQDKIGHPLLSVFIFFIIVFVAVMTFNSLPVAFFMSFLYATFVGGFGYWFFRIWLELKADDTKEYQESKKTPS